MADHISGRVTDPNAIRRTELTIATITDALVHDPENVGDKPFEVIPVELKG